MNCPHGWHASSDCDACMIDKYAPMAARRIAALEDTLAMRDAATRSLCIAIHGTDDPSKSLYDLIFDASRACKGARIAALESALLRITSIIETQAEPDIDAMHDVARDALRSCETPTT